MKTDVIVPHKFRADRRAVWHQSAKTITFEFQNSKGEWKPDYTINDHEAGRDDYFINFYGQSEG